MRSRKLSITFVIAVLFCLANIYTYLRMPEYSTLDDGFVSFGWPFDVYRDGGFAHIATVVWTGVIGNVFVTLCAARIVRSLVGKVRLAVAHAPSGKLLR